MILAPKELSEKETRETQEAVPLLPLPLTSKIDGQSENNSQGLRRRRDAPMQI
jgi:hypothetical protein